MIEDLWAFQNTTLTVIKQSENHTYLVQSLDQRYMLRLTPQDHRTLKAIHSEIDFILLIAHSQPSVHVCKPIPLVSNKEEHVALITPYADNHQWYGVLYEHAKGISVTNKWCGLTDERIIEAHGQTLAKMHQAIMKKGNNPEKWSQMEKGVPAWDQTHSASSSIEKTVRPRAESGHKTSQKLLKMWEDKVYPFIRSCGEPNDSVFGVIHGDFNITNFFYEETNSSELPILWVFDFDQMHYNWLGYDIAVILHQLHYFNERLFGNPPIEGFEMDKFTKIFLDGYRKVSGDVPYLDPKQLEGLIQFCEFCHSSLAVDVLFKAENGRHFEASITDICDLLVKRFESRYSSL